MHGPLGAGCTQRHTRLAAAPPQTDLNTVRKVTDSLSVGLDAEGLNLRRGIFGSVPELIASIEDYLTVNNDDQPKLYVWTATAESILYKAPVLARPSTK